MLIFANTSKEVRRNVFKIWKECGWQLRIFKHKSYGETALKPARGLGRQCELPSGVRNFYLFRRFFKDKMHRLVTLQVVTPKLHIVPMRIIRRDAAETFWGIHPLDWHLPVLMKLQAIQKQNRHLSINAKLFIFLLWLVIHNCILFATVFILEIPTLNFAHIFSVVSCCQSFLALMLAVIMFS